jgi:integrase
MKFTKRNLDTIPPGPPKGTWHVESGPDKLTGFFVVAFPSSKVFYVRYRAAGGIRRVVKVGEYGVLTVDQARTKAREILASATLGSDPAADAQKRRGMPSFQKWTEAYLERIDKKKKSPREDHRFLKVAAKKWRAIPLNEVTRLDVVALHQELGRKHPTAANRWLASVRACLSAAVKDGLLAANPALLIEHHREAPPRARVLSDPELAAVVKAIMAEEDEHARAALRLLVETGARLSEVLRAKWEDVDLDAGSWRIPSPKADTPQMVPLNSPTVAFLRRLPHIDGSPYICPGRFSDRPRADLRDAWDRVKARAASSAPTIMNDLRVHDVRRTFGLAVARKAGLHVASKLLRHSDIRVTEKVYTPLGFEELRDAVEARGKTLSFRQLKRKRDA